MQCLMSILYLKGNWWVFCYSQLLFTKPYSYFSRHFFGLDSHASCVTRTNTFIDLCLLLLSTHPGETLSQKAFFIPIYTPPRLAFMFRLEV